MATKRITRIASLAALVALGLTAGAPAANGPAPVVKVTGTISPKRGHIQPGTPLTLKLDTRFRSVPAGGNFVLQSLDYLFPKGASINGRLFPSCKAGTLEAAHGVLSTCPKGSKIGSGVASGIAVALGVKSSGKLTLFNGPGGKSITMNIDVEHPAAINETFSAPLTKAKGKYAYKLSVTIPDTLKTIIGGDVVVTRILVTNGASRMVNGVKRGWTEAVNCPKSGKAPLHADFTFNQNAKASTDTTVAC
jgi:hypothetical protein